MGLTNQSTGSAVMQEELVIRKEHESDCIIALAGNPNVGKSTVFNALTGLNQHTGNWPGKTVTNAQGRYTHGGRGYILVDLPGTYSIMASSVEEEVARDFICFGHADVSVVVTDATSLERNLNLVLQVIEVSPKVVVCVNLLDEAKKKKIEIDLFALSQLLGVPVVGTCARASRGLDALMDEIAQACDAPQIHPVLTYPPVIEEAVKTIQQALDPALSDAVNLRWLSLKLLDPDPTLQKSLAQYLGRDLLEDPGVGEAIASALAALQEQGLASDPLRDCIVGSLVRRAEEIYSQCVTLGNAYYHARDRKIDRILTSKLTGIPIMLLLLGLIFYLTITGANYPSALLSKGFFWLEDQLSYLLLSVLHAPAWLHGALVLGMFRTLGWVVSVMLPPMAIFFPLFTLLEDLGYLPRVAFNMDRFFKKACAHGKQALTMCMGFGCNACGVIGCRIIDSPRERLIAILTNSFVPCNGRFPTLISVITMFFVAGSANSFGQSVLSTLLLLSVILLGILMTLAVSKLLSKTVLKGMPSSFALELPPYRKPQIGKVIVRSVLDRTLFVLGRAVAVAAPAGLVIWVMANVTVGGSSLLVHCAGFLDPFARLMGLDGIILMAFLLGFPANEIVFPIIIMSYLATGSMMEMENLGALHTLLVQNGWSITTAVCTMLFSLFHFPCGTTLWTIHKETQSKKWTGIAFLLPTVIGILLCILVATVGRFIGLA